MKRPIGLVMLCWLVFSCTKMAVGFTDTSSGIILANNASVRAEGLGGALAAVTADEAGAQSFNPAGLRLNALPEFSAMYYRGLTDDTFGSLYFDMPLSQSAAVGAAVGYYDAGNFELNAAEGDTSVSAQRDILATLTGAYSLRVLEMNTVWGANLKLLNSTLLGKYSALAAAVDLGVQVEGQGFFKPLHVGLAVKNLGTPIKYIDTADPLGTCLLLGAAYDVYQNKTVSLLVAGDALYDFFQDWRGSIGAELRLFNLLALRGGYKLGYDLNTVTVGLGFQWSAFQIDYAFSPTQALSSLHRVSLSYTLLPSTPAEEKKSESKTESKAEAKPATGAVSAPAQKLSPYYNVETEREETGEVEKVLAQVLEIRKIGGRASEVVINLGSNNGIKAGFKGILVDSAGRPVAAIVIQQVDPTLSLADVIGLSREIERNVQAVIDKPVGK